MTGSLSLTFDFALVEILAATRLPMRVRTLRTVITAGFPVFALMVFALALGGAVLLRPLLGASADTELAVLAMGCTLMLSAGATFVDVLGSRKWVVRRAPNRGLLRALDVSPTEVHAVYVVLWRLPLFIGCMAACLAVSAVATATSPWLRALVVATPAALSLVHMTFTYRSLFRPHSVRRLRWSETLGALVLIACVVPLGLVVRAHGDFTPTTIRVEEDGFVGAMFLGTIGVAIGLFALLFSSRRSRRRTAHWEGFDGVDRHDVGAHRCAKPSVRAAVAQGWRSDPRRAQAIQAVGAWVAAAVFAITAWGFAPGTEAKPTFVRAAVVGGAASAALFVCDCFQAHHGFSAQMQRIRTWWELGRGTRELIDAHLRPLALYVLLVGGAALAAGWALGDTSAGVSGMLASVGAGAASALADTLGCNVRNADGSLTTTAVTSLVSLFLFAPLGLLLISARHDLHMGAWAWAGVLSGGVIVCQSLRIRRRASHWMT